MRPKILIFAPFYLPGYRGGGPIRSVAGVIDRLSDDYQFLLVTLDRDLGQVHPYDEVVPDTWSAVGPAQVLYRPPQKMGFWRTVKILRETTHDVVYLNGFFGLKFSIYPMLAMWLKLVPRRPIILAPRGEFSEGALVLKKWKKFAFLKFSSIVGLHDSVIWQASTELERSDIRRLRKEKKLQILVSENLTANSPAFKGELFAEDGMEKWGRGSQDQLKICFLSRISPKKNLHFALNVLRDVRASVIFTIYGPKEDDDYWRRCEESIRLLPRNIEVVYAGGISNDRVRNVLQEHDLFLFPTHGENFGHVILEALGAGLPLLISDQTPWLKLEEKGVGWDVSLSNPSQYSRIIENFSLLNAEAYSKMRRACLRFAASKISNGEAELAHRELFSSAVNSSNNF